MDQRSLNEILRNNPQTDFYANLGVPANATAEDIKKAHRKLSSDLHADKAGEKFIESDPKLQRQYNAMLRGVQADIDGLSEQQLQQRAAGKRQFEGRTPEDVKEMLKRDAVSGVRKDFLASHDEKFTQFRTEREARLKAANTAAEVLGDNSLRGTYDNHRAHLGAAPNRAGQARQEPVHQEAPRQEPVHQEAPRQEAPRQEPPKQAAAAGGAGGGQPPHDNPPHGGNNGGGDANKPHGEPQHAKVKMPGKIATVRNAFMALAAAGAVGFFGAVYLNNKNEQENNNQSPIAQRTYPTVAEQMADKNAGGTERIFVEQALGAGGLTKFAGQQSGRELESRIGLSARQFRGAYLLFNTPDVKSSLTKQMKTPEQKASVTFVQGEDGKFSVADAKAKRNASEQAKFDAQPKLTINLDKDKVELVYDDPRNGKGPRSTEYAHSSITKAQLVQDQKARETAVSAAMDEVGAQRSAAAAAVEAAAKRQGKPSP